MSWSIGAPISCTPRDATGGRVPNRSDSRIGCGRRYQLYSTALAQTCSRPSQWYYWIHYVRSEHQLPKEIRTILWRLGKAWAFWASTVAKPCRWQCRFLFHSVVRSFAGELTANCSTYGDLARRRARPKEATHTVPTLLGMRLRRLNNSPMPRSLWATGPYRWFRKPPLGHVGFVWGWKPSFAIWRFWVWGPFEFAKSPLVTRTRIPGREPLYVCICVYIYIYIYIYIYAHT